MKRRPHKEKRFAELESLYHDSKDEIPKLEEIYNELSYRERNSRIPRLKKMISERIEYLKNIERKEISKQLGKNISWDEYQNEVIIASENEYKYVEAGPGTGKTAVACAKVAHLINEFDLEPSNILLISFTRTAIKEIKNRIQELLKEDKSLNGLRIYTLDSFTWSILNSFTKDEEDLFNGFNENIDSLVMELRGENYLIDEIFEEFEHVIIDEAQDLVGRRANLVIEIIEKLSDECGITVFADSAQGIYGFTNDDDVKSSKDEQSVVEMIKNDTRNNINRIELINVHRTDNPKLKKLFMEGRAKLLNRSKGNQESWEGMRDFIVNNSNEHIEGVKPKTLDKSKENLILFRTKAEVLKFSSDLWSGNMPHSIRMSDTVRRVHPWIGRIFSEYTEDYIDETEFQRLWDKLTHDDPRNKSDESWELLWNYCGESNRGVSLRRLREVLSRDRPPIDFLVDEEKINNIIVSTIHSSKGRESNVVYLILPKKYHFNAFESSGEQILEEERVLYVGATRAINKLITSDAQPVYNKGILEGRICSKLHNRKDWKALNIQLGLPKDLDPLKSIDGSFGIEPNSIQKWLWKNANKYTEAVIKYDYGQGDNYIKVKNGSIVGGMSSSFSYDLWDVANTFGNGNYKPNGTIKNVYIAGSSTYVIPEEKRSQVSLPWQKSGIILIPVLTGFPMVFFNKRKNDR